MRHHSVVWRGRNSYTPNQLQSWPPPAARPPLPDPSAVCGNPPSLALSSCRRNILSPLQQDSWPLPLLWMVVSFRLEMTVAAVELLWPFLSPSLCPCPWAWLPVASVLDHVEIIFNCFPRLDLVVTHHTFKRREPCRHVTVKLERKDLQHKNDVTRDLRFPLDCELAPRLESSVDPSVVAVVQRRVRRQHDKNVAQLCAERGMSGITSCVQDRDC